MRTAEDERQSASRAHQHGRHLLMPAGPTEASTTQVHLVVNTLSVTPKTGGVKTYLVNLVRALLEADGVERVTLICSRVNHALFEAAASQPRCSIEVLPLTSESPLARIFYDQIVVPLHMLRWRDAVLVTPSNVASLAHRGPQVVIVQAPLSIRAIRHAVPKKHQAISRSQRLYFDLLMPWTMRRSTAVIAVSEHLQAALHRQFPGLRSKVRMVHEGVNNVAFGREPAGKPKPEHGGYLLFVSTLFPYKNAERVVESFADLRARGRLPEHMRLKIAGKDPDGRQQAQLAALCARLGIAEAVDFLGMVPHDEIALLYRHATAFIFPSAVETFGLPVLEAMQCGVPVVASDRMAVPEVVGDAGLVVDPDDVGALAAAIDRVLSNADLRRALIARGLKRTQAFSWTVTARGVLDVARAVLARS